MVAYIYIMFDTQQIPGGKLNTYPMLVLTNVGWLLKIDSVINQGLGSDIEYTTCCIYL